MARKARIVLPGYPHHVVQKGHNSQNIFRDNGDRQYYMKLFEEHLGRSKCTLMAYCLMSNHVHLMIKPPDREALINCLHGVGYRYAKYFNRTSRRTGALFADRYYSSTICEEAYMWRAAQYICLNPVRASIVADPAEYRWSSTQAMLTGNSNGVPVEDWILPNQRADFREMLLEPAEISNITTLWKRNIPYASPVGISHLEEVCGVKLTPNARSRKKTGDGGKYMVTNLPRPCKSPFSFPRP